ncbi:SpoIID/LytB domain-containing protein [Brevibacillus fluminis]|uniref:SpoIID/LytB domain-containing protein n=1 Tax=Brevibacillus fluminis TaxID=511487 RepID=A0A3M8DRT3_9BACL|nr:SpoIID/LytB domain-containing protein [Brevibacillus fluminis]RNB90604.1 SpoIID/LytB domain-containing protein [Brevibacillus fluminis]
MRNKWIGKVALFASALSLAIPYGTTGVAAKADEIRVALFIDAGVGYRGVVPAVTLSSDSGLAMELQSESGDVSLPDMPGNAARFKVDQLQVTLIETPNKSEAQRITTLASQQKIDASIQVEGSDAQPFYRVVSGSFESYQAAQTHAQKAKALGVAPKITGPYHLDAGQYGSLKEAAQVESIFESSGIPAHVVLVPIGKNKASYGVWVGSEVNKDSLAKLTVTASAVLPTISYRTATAQSYVLVNRELSGGSTIYQYAFAPQSTLVVEPDKGGGTPLIGVLERDKRKYRGQFELSKYNGYLTVVNQLPVEEYLYGVVGSEMSTGWPLEALKAQAVLARTKAMSQPNKYKVADVSDTVNEQAYYGYTKEAADIRKAVDKTEGEVIRYNGKLVEALYYSNAGGITADGTEVWGNPVPYTHTVESEDAAPQVTAIMWYRVELADGTIGYIRSDYVNISGTNSIGLQTGIVNTDNLNFRNGPSATYNKVLQTLSIGTAVTIISEEPEENAYSWTRGPYTAQEVTTMINNSKAGSFSSPISTLSVSERGPSGRVIAMEADGRELKVSSPDAHRSVFKQSDSSLRSTRFTVEQLGGFTVVGANGRMTQAKGSGQLYAISGSGYGTMPANGFSEDFVVYTGASEWNVLSKTKKFLFRGNGFGHGLGVSQYGAKAMAEQGLDYRQILEYYYNDITIGE